MSRIHVVEPSTATPEQKVLLDAIQGQLGMVPRLRHLGRDRGDL